MNKAFKELKAPGKLLTLSSVMVSAIMLGGCFSSSSGSSDPSDTVAGLNVQSSAEAVDGFTSTISVTEDQSVDLSKNAYKAVLDPKAVTLHLNSTDSDHIKITQGTGCDDLTSSTSCKLTIQPDNSFKEGDQITGYISGDNTTQYPITLTIKKIGVSADKGVSLGAGQSGDNGLTFTVTNPTNADLSGFNASISDKDLTLHTDACANGIGAGKSCQLTLDASNSAKRQNNVALSIGGSAYVDNISVVRPSIAMTASVKASAKLKSLKENDPTIKPNQQLTVTLTNKDTVPASGLTIDTDKLAQLIPGLTFDSKDSTCLNGSIAAGGSCQLVLNAGSDLVVDSATISNGKNQLIGEGDNANFDFDPKTQSININAVNYDLNAALQNDVISTNSNISQTATVVVSNGSGQEVTKLSAVSDNKKLTLDKSSTCNGTLAVGESCKYVFDYAPGDISQYSTETAKITVSSAFGAAYNVTNTLNINNFAGFYSLPTDLFKSGNQKVAYRYDEAISINNGIVAVGTDGAGVSISQDGGKTWYNATTVNGLSSNEISDVSVDTKGNVYAVAENSLSFSDDKGRSWKSVSSAFTGKSVVFFAQHQNTDGNLYRYVGTNKGVYYSKGESSKWTQLTNLSDVTAQGFAFDDNNIYIASKNNGVYVTPLPVSASSKVTNYKTDEGLASNDVQAVAVDNGALYAATDSGLSVASTSDLKTWKNYTKDDGLGSNFLNGIVASNGTLYAATTGGVSVLPEASVGHKKWANYNTANTQRGLESNSIHSIAVGNGIVYAATSNGLSSANTNNLKSWTNNVRSNTIGRMYTHSVFVDDSGIYLATTNGGLSVSKDGGESWTTYGSSDLGTSYLEQVTIAKDGTLYVATNGKGIAVSVDNGKTWLSYYPDSDNHGLVTSGIAVSDKRIAVATTNGVYVTSLPLSASSKWQNYTTDQGLADNSVNKVSISDANDMVVAATAQGLSVASTSDLTKWHAYTDKDGLPSSTINNVFINGSTLYIATAKGIASADLTKGYDKLVLKTYTDSSAPTGAVNAIYADKDAIYAALSNGVAISKNSGSTWTTDTTENGVGDQTVDDVYFYGNKLYAATMHGGLSMLNIS